MPAIDLRGGACVQLVGGVYADERVRLPDPLAVARRWRETGFTQLHVVDLDAAVGAGSNDTVIDGLLALGGACEVGGGVRSAARVDALMAAGADRVIVSTRAVEDPDWLGAQARRWPGRLMLAVETKAGAIATHGWSRPSAANLDDILTRTSDAPLAAVFVTSVDVEGRMRGCDLELTDRVLATTPLPVVASGGVTTFDDLDALARRGVWGAVMGMALYTKSIDAERVAREYGR